MEMVDEVREKEKEGQRKRDSSKIYFFIIAIAALLATNIYFYVKFRSSGEKVYTLTVQKESLQIEIDRIEAELDNLNEENVALSEAMKRSELQARKIISDLRKELEANVLTTEQLNQARKIVASLKVDVSGLKTDIADLKAKNEMLKKENEILNSKVSEGESKISGLTAHNSDLKEKVTTASAVKVSNITINGLQEKRKGRVEVETRAKRVDKLEINFTIADNTLAKTGAKEIFVRIINPQGNLIAQSNDIFYVHGEKLQYTFKESINFTNNGEEYKFLWQEEGKDFAKGAYTILLYADNAIMGRSSVILK
ncbi:hypothetical protein ACFU8T_01480 [Sphingobacterium spiritivorum]|uniref:Uncharacterized protein n=1 Tax=Sphingobacterium spiritivorum ATCC 33861 TaxID=525373 RepID=D7VHE4_SPHSI|nr:hypothetical protein [Sphingobacterium spiritivorum]EFK59496.1 hypothetical protein HMPREF0766_10413 [Sphingobacterium spiritivorum ATCC 33861]QQT37835.1 hypothetical protein I6J01_10690 [Sphingobacterium spiritivorum]WQD34643.1 hypothetical protein U0038_02625 [Sphingobacterium spiritivorum]